jgi:hypothetical protein
MPWRRRLAACLLAAAALSASANESLCSALAARFAADTRQLSNAEMQQLGICLDLAIAERECQTLARRFSEASDEMPDRDLYALAVCLQDSRDRRLAGDSLVPPSVRPRRQDIEPSAPRPIERF